MNLPSRQRGLGWFGMLIIFVAFGFIAMIGMKCWPIIFNEIKIQRAVKAVAADAAATKSQEAATKALFKYWTVEDIEHLTFKEVKLTTGEKGKVLAYDYWAQTNVYKNVFVSFHYAMEEPVTAAGGE